MIDLIPLQEVLKEINEVIFKCVMHIPQCSTNSKSSSNIISSECQSPYLSLKCMKKMIHASSFFRLPRLTPHTKLIAVPYHWFRTQVDQMEISIEPIDSEKQVADQFTKSLSSDQFL